LFSLFCYFFPTVTMSTVRVRQHVNPLARKYQVAVPASDWRQRFARPEQPLHLDIGCARGDFPLAMAAAFPDWNFLGVEIRQPLVIEANQERERLGLTNLDYLSANITTSLDVCLPAGSLAAASIQFPDPWFKRRHQKRRVVQPELVQGLATCLQPGGWVLLQSDIEAVALEMRRRFRENPEFWEVTPEVAPSDTNAQGGRQANRLSDWLSQNPLPVPTERELHTQARDLPIYRAKFVRR
jgi:tRNA (guanine-N7-)-methyltransferase